jgi:hypothetical protein
MESPSEPVALVDDEQVSWTTVELEQMPSTVEIDEDGALQKRDKDALQEVNGNDKNSPKKVLDSRKPEYLQFGTLALQKALGAQRSRKHEHLQFGARCCKFSEANPKSDVEWAAYRGKQCPGPGEYTIKRDLTTSGGRFNMSNPAEEVSSLLSYTFRYVSLAELGTVCRVGLRVPMHLCAYMDRGEDAEEASRPRSSLSCALWFFGVLRFLPGLVPPA